MTTDYRALCAELFAAIQLYTGQNPAAADIPSNELVGQLMNAIAATAAALAQPEPVGPSMLRTERRDGPWGEWNALISARPATEPVGPTDNELLGCMLKAAASVPSGQCTGILDWNKEAIAAARAVLARYARPTITPIPVSERLPGPEDCNAEGFCWWFCAADPTVGTFGVAACWVLRKHEPDDDDWRTHWLPAHALPIPRQPAPTAPSP